jgi:hypothetical protein
MRVLDVAVPLLISLAGPSLVAQDHQGCPMHDAHRAAQVDRRHQEATGLPSDGIKHHFLLSADGGSIQLEVKDPARTDDRDRVRAHLRALTRSFSAGDFAMPERIHGRIPPGAEVMKGHQDAIRYTFAETPDGGKVTIATTVAAALAAVHDFLRFQIDDHGTGDPIHRH